MKIIPRPYQQESVEKTLEYFDNKANHGTAGMLIEPVGSGKSLIGSMIAHEFGRKTVVLQPSVELLYQNSEKLTLLGGEFSVYSAKAKSKELSEMTFATIGSIKSLGKEFKKAGIDTVIVDEPHLFPPKKGSMFRKFMDDLKPKHVVGLTATPCRLYQMGSMADNYSVLNFLNNRIGHEHPYFKNVIHTTQVSEMVGRYWSDLSYELYDFDESLLRINTSGSEYTETSVKQALQEQGTNNLIYKRIKKLNEEGIRRILTFCDSLETAEKFARVIPNSAVVTGATDPEERAEIIKRFKAGEIWNVFNYGTLTVGFDYPELEVVILGRPTNSYSLIYQMMGRVVRMHELKEKGYIIDFCNNVKRFGRLEDLDIDYIDNYGWGMFSNDRLLTNVRMGSPKITKAELRGEIIVSADDDDIKFWFGKYNGKKPSECSVNYLEWFMKEFKVTHSTNEEMKRLIFQVHRVIEKEKSLK